MTVKPTVLAADSVKATPRLLPVLGGAGSRRAIRRERHALAVAKARELQWKRRLRDALATDREQDIVIRQHVVSGAVGINARDG